MQHKVRQTYRTTEHWEVWENQIKKLKVYINDMSGKELVFESTKGHDHDKKA